MHLTIAPLPRGSGFAFIDEIVGGAIPRQFIPSVEEGIRDYLHRGPLGFPVVDVSVALTDGQYHTVDSSDMAFKTAGAHGHERGHAEMRSGAAGADPSGDHRRPQ